jgi:hypothetical protein
MDLETQMDSYISQKPSPWRTHKRIACVILHRTLDRMECYEESPSHRSIQDLDNIIAYLKQTLTLYTNRSQ